MNRHLRVCLRTAVVLSVGLFIFAASAHAREAQASPQPKPPPAFETPLHAAALEGDAARVVLLIENGWDVNTVSPVRGDTPIFAALDNKRLEVVNTLLDRGADVNFVAQGRSTPLHHAAIWGNLDVIDRLLTMGADPARINDYSQLPLHYAVQRGNIEATKRLLVSPQLMDKTNTYHLTPLDNALELPKPDIALMLLNHGAHFADNPERTLDRISLCASKSWTEVIEVALRQTESQPELRQRLAERAYNDTFSAGNIPQLRRIGELVPSIASTKPISGLPRLLIAANFGYTEMIQLLLDQGADINEAALPSGWTPLHAAIMGSGDLNLLSLLLINGANPNAGDGLNRTPLHIAAHTGRAFLVGRLLQSGADATRADQLGNTPLHYAVYSGTVAAVRALLDAQVPQVPNLGGKRPYDLAVEAGSAELIAILEPVPVAAVQLPGNFEEILALAAPTEPADALPVLRAQWARSVNSGIPLIHVAAHAGARRAVAALVDGDRKAAELRDRAGFLALHYAAERADAELVRDLLRAGAPVDDQANVPKWTPLHFAANAGQAEAVRVLLENDADKSLRDGLGRTPADLAELQGFPLVAAQLR